MPNTYTLIASNTLSTTAASVTFSSIPNTYTDLVIKLNLRDNSGGTQPSLRYYLNNSSSSIYSGTLLSAVGSTTSSYRGSNQDEFGSPALGNRSVNGSGDTNNTFSNVEIYLPNYAGSTNKPISHFAVVENNSTTVNSIVGGAHLWSSTAAINRIDFYPAGGGSFISGSSFFLYGIRSN